MKTFIVEVEDYNETMFAEMKNLGCKFNPKKYHFICDESKRSNVNAIINHYGSKSKSLTPSQKLLKKDLYNLCMDAEIKKTDKGLFIHNDKGLIEKQEIETLLKQHGLKILRTHNKRRWQIIPIIANQTQTKRVIKKAKPSKFTWCLDQGDELLQVDGFNDGIKKACEFTKNGVKTDIVKLNENGRVVARYTHDSKKYIKS